MEEEFKAVEYCWQIRSGRLESRICLLAGLHPAQVPTKRPLKGIRQQHQQRGREQRLSRPVCWTVKGSSGPSLPLELVLDVGVREVEVDRRRLGSVVAEDLLHRRQADPLPQGRR